MAGIIAFYLLLSPEISETGQSLQHFSFAAPVREPKKMLFQTGIIKSVRLKHSVEQYRKKSKAQRKAAKGFKDEPHG